MLRMIYLFMYSILFTRSVSSNEITNAVFEDHVDGLISAFGDFNGDTLTDVIFITENGKKIEIYLASLEKPYLKPGTSCNFSDFNITSSVPGDYDGDYHMDILITLVDLSNTTIFKILWGNKSHLSGCLIHENEQSNQAIRAQPLILDYDSDTIPDIYGELPNGTRQVWIPKNSTFSFVNINSSNHIRNPHSNAFVDLNDDMAADIFVTIENNSFEIWENKEGYFEDFKKVQFPYSYARLGQSVFFDMDRDGNIDHIVPVCFNVECTNNSIYLYNSTKWFKVTDSFQSDSDGSTWGFVNNSANHPVTLTVGDYDLDGYPDVVAVLHKNSSSPKIKQAVLLANIGCSTCLFPRQLKPQWNNSLLSDYNGISQVAFYDIYQDGILDFLLVNETLTPDGIIKKKVIALQNTLAKDVCFIKVLVSSGMCKENCSSDHEVHDVNYPGSIVRYFMDKMDGSPQTSVATQLSQSAYFALQLPYTIFGLGSTPNFVNELIVGNPPNGSNKNYNHTWHVIVPNSQMIVFALKTNSTQIYWSNLLYLSRSRILMTSVALITTCAVVALVIGGFHWKEKVADREVTRSARISF